MAERAAHDGGAAAADRIDEDQPGRIKRDAIGDGVQHIVRHGNQLPRRRVLGLIHKRRGVHVDLSRRLDEYCATVRMIQTVQAYVRRIRDHARVEQPASAKHEIARLNERYVADARAAFDRQ
jgi:hypothetical protein